MRASPSSLIEKAKERLKQQSHERIFLKRFCDVVTKSQIKLSSLPEDINESINVLRKILEEKSNYNECCIPVNDVYNIGTKKSIKGRKYSIELEEGI